MLTALRISGLALLDDVEVEFGRGMNVITGETGAGKSILLDALHLALGGRMSPDVFREGADEVVVEALFEVGPEHPVLARLRAAGLPVDAGARELLVRRSASRSGRGRAFLNGSLCTVAMLQACLRGLVDVTTQHEHVSLLDESTHLSLLDGFAGLSAGGGLLGGYRETWTSLVRARRERATLEADRDAGARRAEEIRFQLEEIEAAEPRVGELEALEAERQVLMNGEKLRLAARTAEALVYSDEASGLERIGRALRMITDVAALDGRLDSIAGTLRAATSEVEDAGLQLFVDE
jgi:DNA repair protein RecN (Recombination protein N)